MVAELGRPDLGSTTSATTGSKLMSSRMRSATEEIGCRSVRLEYKLNSWMMRLRFPVVMTCWLITWMR